MCYFFHRKNMTWRQCQCQILHLTLRTLALSNPGVPNLLKNITWCQCQCQILHLTLRTLALSYPGPQNFVAFSEYTNFNRTRPTRNIILTPSKKNMSQICITQGHCKPLKHKKTFCHEKDIFFEMSPFTWIASMPAV